MLNFEKEEGTEYRIGLYKHHLKKLNVEVVSFEITER